MDEVILYRLGISRDAFQFLEQTVLLGHSQCFVSDKARRWFKHRLMLERFKPSLWERVLKGLRNIPLVWGVVRGQWLQFFQDGTAPPEIRREVRRIAGLADFSGAVSLARLDPATRDPHHIYEALKKTIAAINGFAFLDRPPVGRNHNSHTILIKPGVNWGYFLYPTVTSWQSVYALVSLCFAEAEVRGAHVEKIIIGDESGIECALHEHTTTQNLVYTGIYHAAVLAGLERAASLESRHPEKFSGAERLLPRAWEIAEAMTSEQHRESPPNPEADDTDEDYKKMVWLAHEAGVQIIAFDEDGTEEELYTRVHPSTFKRFSHGISIPRIVHKEVTDIINLPKPPGRHLIMGNTGLTGAVKNYVGLLKGSERSPAPGLHGFTDRAPKFRMHDSKSALQYYEKLNREIQEDRTGKKAGRLAWEVIATNPREALDLGVFHEKIVEIYLAFKEKERFCATDMRQTLQTHGPDFGNTIDIGAVIAAQDAVSFDAVAGALLELAYEREERQASGKKVGFLRGLLNACRPGGIRPESYLFGQTWLKPGTSPFDLKSHIAANLYGLGPANCDHLKIEGIDFSCQEMLALTGILRRGQPVPAAH